MISLLPFIAVIVCLLAGASVDQVPVARLQVTPIYPYELQRHGVAGSAQIGFIVDADGNVRDPFVIRATDEKFGLAAVDAVARWKFRPGYHAGHPVNVRMEVPVVFALDDSAEFSSDPFDLKRDPRSYEPSGS